MTPEPLWRRMARRPSWQRHLPLRFSDVDPTMPIHAAANRILLSLDRIERQQRAQQAIDKRDGTIHRATDPAPSPSTRVTEPVGSVLRIR